VELYRRAADEAAEDAPLRAAILEHGAEVIAYWQGGYDAGLEWAAEALELAEAAYDPQLLARALAKHGYMEFFGGRGQPHARMRRAEELELAAEPRRFERGPRYLYSLMLFQAGELEEARSRLVALCELGRLTGDVASAMAVITLAWVEAESGRWAEAWELASEARELTEQGGWDVVDARAAFTLAHIEALRGDVEAARAHGLAALELTERTGRLSRGPLGALGLLELSLERYAEAWGYLEPALERNRSRSFEAPASLAFDAVEALAGLGRADDARRVLDPLAEASSRFGWPWAVAASARCRGLTEAVEGALEAAEASLLQAVEIGAGVGMPFELGRSLLALGTVQRRLRRKQASRTTLRRALETFDRLGAKVFAERARRQIARIGGRAAPAVGLSATEADIVELVCAGRSNREVASALHLSPKTVEWNLSKIYRKLGVRSRTELAARH
jgi:DNA-binding CsgD family transcriptional regulator